MWPFRRKIDPAGLKQLLKETHELIRQTAQELQDQIDKQEWRLDNLMRFYEECTGHICEASWGPPPLISPGSPMRSQDFQIPSPPQEVT